GVSPACFQMASCVSGRRKMRKVWFLPPGKAASGSGSCPSWRTSGAAGAVWLMVALLGVYLGRENLRLLQRAQDVGAVAGELVEPLPQAHAGADDIPGRHAQLAERAIG